MLEQESLPFLEVLLSHLHQLVRLELQARRRGPTHHVTTSRRHTTHRPPHRNTRMRRMPHLLPNTITAHQHSTPNVVDATAEGAFLTGLWGCGRPEGPTCATGPRSARPRYYLNAKTLTTSKDKIDDFFSGKKFSTAAGGSSAVVVGVAGVRCPVSGVGVVLLCVGVVLGGAAWWRNSPWLWGAQVAKGEADDCNASLGIVRLIWPPCKVRQQHRKERGAFLF